MGSVAKTHLTERLRASREFLTGDGYRLMHEAADRIEELERKRDDVRQTLGEIAFDIRHGRLNEALGAVQPALIALDDAEKEEFSDG